MIGQEIALIASKYLGKRETPNNSGFKDKDFEKRMRDVGWDKGQSWCVYFCELVWMEAYAKNDEVKRRITELFSGSATATYKNFDLNKIFTVSQTPVIGAIAIYRYGSDWRGHAAIVEKILPNATQGIDGNTNDDGGREGIEVARKIRKIKKPYTSTGLNLVGFIHPIQ
jgi:hypothetical protein